EPRRWLTEAIALAGRIARLRGEAPGTEPAQLGEIGPLGQSRWLVALVGAGAAAWPPTDRSDAELAGRLLVLAASADPRRLTFADLRGGGTPARAAAPRDPVSLA